MSNRQRGSLNTQLNSNNAISIRKESQKPQFTQNTEVVALSKGGLVARKQQGASGLTAKKPLESLPMTTGGKGVKSAISTKKVNPYLNRPSSSESEQDSEPTSESALGEEDYDEDDYEISSELDEQELDVDEMDDIEEEDEDLESMFGIEEDEDEVGNAFEEDEDMEASDSDIIYENKEMDEETRMPAQKNAPSSSKKTETKKVDASNSGAVEMKESSEIKATALSTLLNADMRKPTVEWNSAPYNPKATFEMLGIKEWLCKALGNLAIVRPTEIQQRTIPSILQGHDIVARAKTGSGKTACFALPIIQQLSEDPYGIFALVLTPSRELAFQIAEQFEVFGHNMNIHTCVVIGGMQPVIQAKELDSRPHIVVATPGRLADLIMRHNIELHSKHLKYLVLDEADRLLEATFTEDLLTILDAIPDVSSRQTLLFSATITRTMLSVAGEGEKKKVSKKTASKASGDNEFDIQESSHDDGGLDLREVSVRRSTNKQVKLISQAEPSISRKLERKLFKNPLWAQASTTEDPIVDTLDQYYLFIPQAVKEAYLAYILRVCNPSHPDFDKSKTFIVFTATCDGCEFLTQLLRLMNIPNSSLHSKLSQPRRTASLHKFKSGADRVLIATDAASRGLDIPSVTTVINYDVPRFVADYVHRVGRTARAGRGGQAITFVSQYEIDIYKLVEKTINKTLEAYPVPEKKVLEILKDTNSAKKNARIRMLDFAVSDGRLDNLTVDKERGKQQDAKRKRGF